MTRPISQLWMLRSIPALGLMLILTTTLELPALAQNSSKPLTWQSVLEQLFRRQPRQGGTRGDQVCVVTPVYIPERQPKTGDRLPSLLLSEKPFIAWYGNYNTIKIRNRATKEEWKHEIAPKKSTEKSIETADSHGKSVLKTLQYDGTPLLPDQSYEVIFETKSVNKDAKDSRPSLFSNSSTLSQQESHRFRTHSQTDRDRLNRQLQTIAANAAKTNTDPILPQVEFLIQQNLVNDAQMLISQQSNPSPELAAAIAGSQSPCEKKLRIKEPELKTPPTRLPSTPPKP